MITGEGIFTAGLVRLFVVLPRLDANPGDDADRAIAWQRALVWSFTFTWRSDRCLGCALSVVPGDPRSVDITWATFCVFLLIDLGVIVA
jgi:hypothetical protein